jgi:hypothetical protein
MTASKSADSAGSAWVPAFAGTTVLMPTHMGDATKITDCPGRAPPVKSAIKYKKGPGLRPTLLFK